MAEIVAKKPEQLSDLEVGAFLALVRAGGEVASHGLADRVRSAKLLAFAYSGAQLVGVAALKCPVPSYRRRVASSSCFELSATAFPYELGWVYVLPEARMSGISVALSRAVLGAADDHGVFATARTDNEGIHRTLKRLGFEGVGVPFMSGRQAHQLKAFVKHAAQPVA